MLNDIYAIVLIVLFNDHLWFCWKSNLLSIKVICHILFPKFVYYMNIFAWWSKKYNFAISVIFGGLKLKKCVLLKSLMITSFYLPSVGKNSLVISNCCCLNDLFEIIWFVIFSGTFILKFKLTSLYWFPSMTFYFGK